MILLQRIIHLSTTPKLQSSAISPIQQLFAPPLLAADQVLVRVQMLASEVQSQSAQAMSPALEKALQLCEGLEGPPSLTAAVKSGLADAQGGSAQSPETLLCSMQVSLRQSMHCK